MRVLQTSLDILRRRASPPKNETFHSPRGEGVCLTVANTRPLNLLFVRTSHESN